MNIVITGASRGIGFQTALRFSENSRNNVYALSRNKEGLQKLIEASGGRVRGVECDLANEDSVVLAAKKIAEKSSSVEILINNAGLLINKRIEKLTVKEWKEVY